MNSKQDHQSLPDAAYGAAQASTEVSDLPAVFPREMGPNAMKYLQEVVDSGLSSKIVARFEETFAKAHGRRYCVASPGCTQALFALFLGLDFEPGDEVIVSPIADYGDLCGLLFENLVPVFCDTDADTGLITAETIKPCITDRTKAILAVNFFGLPCDFDPIMALAREHGILVIEDVCQSILSTYKGRISGSLADIATFSFDSEKTCGGDVGGALLLDDEDLYNRIVNRALSRGAKQFPGFGRKHIYRGSALRMPQCTAATCLANWEILPPQVENRTAMAGLLDSLIEDVPGVQVYRVPKDRTHTYWMYGFRIDPEQFTCSTQDLAAQLKEAGIASCGLGMYYILPLGVPFLAENVAAGNYPFNIPVASRQVDYEAERICPNAIAFMSNFIRWFWTEKYQSGHIHQIAGIIRSVCEHNHRSRVTS